MRAWLLVLLLAVFAVRAAPADAPGITPAQQARDFDVLWSALDQGYAYFDRDKPTWRRARSTARARATQAASRDAFVAALEATVAVLRDDHVTLSERSRAAPRRVPDETDIWATWKERRAVVEAIRTFGEADIAGVKPGHVVQRIDGQPIDKVLRQRLGPTGGPAALDWALRHALAGPRTGPLRLDVLESGKPRTLAIERGATNGPGNGPPLIGRRMGEDRDIGYIRLKPQAGARVAEHFDATLDHLKDTRALIVDLREYGGPPARAATERILGRFVADKRPWQLRQVPGQRPISNSVAPYGDAPYRAPLLVLVDRWTAGEGEALAAGLQAVANARLVGTPMAGLRGELREVTLPHSGIVLRFPAQKTFHIDGTPRESLRPHIAIDLAAPSGGPGDPILYQALKLLEKRG